MASSVNTSDEIIGNSSEETCDFYLQSVAEHCQKFTNATLLADHKNCVLVVKVKSELDTVLNTWYDFLQNFLCFESGAVSLVSSEEIERAKLQLYRV